MTDLMIDNPPAKRILVVEDEVWLAIELEDALREGGFDVIGPAASVRQALSLLNDERPDAAVLDVTLGGEKVTPVALLLKSIGIPFVLASASDAAELARHDCLADARNLGKPTDLVKLVEVVRGL
jgi:DNA-binding response OmpR family regulator